jgi:hypothetical protein
VRKFKGILNFVLVGLGCFFEAGLDSFAGCVIIRRYSSKSSVNVKRRQKILYTDAHNFGYKL